MHGLGLADDDPVQVFFQMRKLCILGFLYFCGRNPRPKLNDFCHILHRHLDAVHGLPLRGQLCLQADDLGFDLRQLLVVRPLLGLFLLSLLLFQARKVLFIFHPFGDFRVAQAAAGTGLIQQVDGLIRQETVGDIALGQRDRAAHDGFTHLYMVVRLIILADARDNSRSIVDGRLLDLHRLETALQRLVFLNVFAVFCKRRRADDLNLPPGERRLKDVGCVHRALGIPRPGDVVDLINK